MSIEPVELRSHQPYSIYVKVVNPSDMDLTDYQVKVVLNTSSLISERKMREDCGDIRVYDLNGNKLNYCVFNCNSDNTEIWVKIPSLPANSETTIKIEHGDLSLASESNPDAVFLFYDDFSNGLSKWDSYINASVVDDGTGNKVLELKAINEGGYIIKYNLHHDNVAIEMKYMIKQPGEYGPRLGIRFRILRNLVNGYDVINEVDRGHKIRKLTQNWTIDLTGNGCFMYKRDKWYNIYVRVFENIIRGYLGECDELVAQDNEYSYGDTIMIETWDEGNTLWIDDIRIRKYVEPEPYTEIIPPSEQPPEQPPEETPPEERPIPSNGLIGEQQTTQPQERKNILLLLLALALLILIANRLKKE